jgi:ferredoxin
MELLDFLERLAPFSTPDLILRDEKPRFVKPERGPIMSDERNRRKPAPAQRRRFPKPKNRPTAGALLRTILLTGGVLGAALSGFLPLVYAQKKRCARPARWMKRIFSSCIKCGQCVQVCPVQPSSWPT